MIRPPCCACCNDRRPLDEAGHCETCARRLAGLCAYTRCTNRRSGRRRYCWGHDRQHRRGVPLGPLRPHLRLTETAAEVEWLIGTDTPDSIAKRLGYSGVESLQKTLYRARRGDLAMKLQLKAVA